METLWLLAALAILAGGVAGMVTARDRVPRIVWTEYGTGVMPGHAEERSPS